MEPSTAEPSAALKHFFKTALEDYSEAAFRVSFAQLQESVALINAEEDEIFTTTDQEEEGWERFHTLQNKCFLGGGARGVPFSEDLDAFAETMQFNDLLDDSNTGRVLPIVAPPPSRPEQVVHELERLQQCVQGAAADGETATLPAEFRAFAGLVDSLFPPGLPSRMSDVVCYNGLTAVEVPTLAEVDRRLHLSQGGWVVSAGFLTEVYAPKDKASSGWALCEKADGDRTLARSKAWRIFFARIDDSTPLDFDSVEKLLEWYASFGLR